MEEVFVERIIKRKISITGIIIRFFSVLLVMAGVFSIFFLGMLGITITVLLGYLTYLCWIYTSLEYEYSFLNGELTIDKIMGQRKRKALVSYDIKNAEIVAPSYSDEILRKIRGIKTEDYSSGYNKNEMYSMILNNGKESIQVMFEPDEKMIDAMYHVRPNIVKKA